LEVTNGEEIENLCYLKFKRTQGNAFTFREICQTILLKISA